MGSKRTPWHFFFSLLLRRYAPSTFEIRDEVPLSSEPSRMDFLVIRRAEPAEPGEPATPAQTLHALWPLLPLVTVAELKTIGRPYGTGDLDRLWSYVHAYYAAEHPSLPARDALAALLIVPRRTPTLEADIAAMGLTWIDLGGGYWELSGGLFRLFLVEIDRVADQPDEDLLALYSRHGARTPRAVYFWGELNGAKANMNPKELEGYNEAIRQVMSTIPIEERLADLTPEQRLAGLTPEQIAACLPPEQLAACLPPEQIAACLPPEQRLAGLTPEQIAASVPPEKIVASLDHDHQALALPLDVLRLLPEEYFRTLSPHIAAELRRRIREGKV